MSSKKCIVMVGPSPSSHGGVASVVTSWKSAGLFERWPITYLETHVEGSKLDKFHVGISAMLRFFFLLASNRVACVHLHVARRISFWRKSIFALAAIALRRPVLLHIHSGGFPAFFHDHAAVRDCKCAFSHTLAPRSRVSERELALTQPTVK